MAQNYQSVDLEQEGSASYQTEEPELALANRRRSVAVKTIGALTCVLGAAAFYGHKGVAFNSATTLEEATDVSAWMTRGDVQDMMKQKVSCGCSMVFTRSDETRTTLPPTTTTDRTLFIYFSVVTFSSDRVRRHG